MGLTFALESLVQNVNEPAPTDLVVLRGGEVFAPDALGVQVRPHEAPLHARPFTHALQSDSPSLP